MFSETPRFPGWSGSKDGLGANPRGGRSLAVSLHFGAVIEEWTFRLVSDC